MTRARDLGIPFEGVPGPWNAITDVAGVTVGYTTLIAEADHARSIRTGVTAILPRGAQPAEPVFAGWFALNGNGEMTGAAWLEESGFLEGPVVLTNTHSVGVARDAVVAWQIQHRALFQPWSNPVVAETYDGYLNDINGFHVQAAHVWQALDAAQSGPVAEGNVGGGTGMMCYEFKGGTGTASRRVTLKGIPYTIGVLVQANFGVRHQLQIAGVPVGKRLTADAPFTGGADFYQEQGSIIVVAATDAPLLPHQLKRVAKRASLGIARTGGMAGNSSGDIFVAFATANAGAARPPAPLAHVQMLPNEAITPLFSATALATEEAILNALIAAETMQGHEGRIAVALPHDPLQKFFAEHLPPLPR
jgi:D-aminopeptidase